jgi:hypothetical protein
MAKVQNKRGKYSHSATKQERNPELVKMWIARQERLKKLNGTNNRT